MCSLKKQLSSQGPWTSYPATHVLCGYDPITFHGRSSMLVPKYLHHTSVRSLAGISLMLRMTSRPVPGNAVNTTGTSGRPRSWLSLYSFQVRSLTVSQHDEPLISSLDNRYVSMPTVHTPHGACVLSILSILPVFEIIQHITEMSMAFSS